MAHFLRRLSARFPIAAKRWRVLQFNVRDALDMYVRRPAPVIDSPLGFKFGGLASAHHAAMQKGEFEQAEVKLLSRLLAHADVMIDVGANVGYFTCLARSLGKLAVAIEPMPKNLVALFGNLRANGWTDTEVFPVAVAERPGIQTLYGASSTGASLIDNWAGAPSTFHRTICVSTLDNLLSGRFLGAQLLVKIDVEGFEFSALRGAVELMARAVKPMWLIEITFQEYHPGGHNPTFSATFELFFSQGYRVYLLDDQTIRQITKANVDRWSVDGHTDSTYVNYLFLPETSTDLAGQIAA